MRREMWKAALQQPAGGSVSNASLEVAGEHVVIGYESCDSQREGGREEEGVGGSGGGVEGGGGGGRRRRGEEEEVMEGEESREHKLC